jgi:hypothetical protein
MRPVEQAAAAFFFLCISFILLVEADEVFVSSEIELSNALLEASTGKIQTVSMSNDIDLLVLSALSVSNAPRAVTLNGNGYTLHGNSAQCFWIRASTVTINDLIISGCTSMDVNGGAALTAGSGATVYLFNIRFIENTATFGAVYLEEAVVYFFDFIFSANTNYDIYLEGSYSSVDFLSECPENYYADQPDSKAATINCFGCEKTEDYADTLTLECTICPKKFSCCGSIGVGSCVDDSRLLTCTDAENYLCPLPSTAPSMLPTPSPPPSFAPTPPPTVACSPGEFLVAAANVCVSCGIGTFSNVSTLPWPSSCALCSGGTYASQSSSTQCKACPVGKLPTEDRSGFSVRFSPFKRTKPPVCGGKFDEVT